MSVPSTCAARAWRYALASAIGSSHVRSGTPCQDASASEVFSPAGASVFVGVVSDGAGSAPLSQIGSRLCCEIWRDEARAALEGGAGVAALDRAFAAETLRRFQAVLGRVARRAARPVRDFACTLLFAAADERSASFAQIGDGAIVVAPAESGGYGWVFWPQQGEYVNQTFFASESRAAERLCFEQRHGVLDELALFSDGLQGLVLDQRLRTAHARFFEPMFAAVRRAPPGHSEALSRSLEGYLRSRSVETRTDDDKSLILASRRAPVLAPALPRPEAASPVPSIPQENRA